jgi:hypothetical protein
MVLYAEKLKITTFSGQEVDSLLREISRDYPRNKFLAELCISLEQNFNCVRLKSMAVVFFIATS